MVAKSRPVEIPVSFGGVSIGQSTARLGLRIDRSHIDLIQADELFCGHRLTGDVVLGNRDDGEGQTTMFDTDFIVSGHFDVKQLGVNADRLSTGLTFSLKDVEIETLAKFSKGVGKLVVREVGAIPADAPSEHDEDHVPGTLKAAGPWRDVPIDTLIGGALLKSLTKAGIDTVGALSDYTASEQRLTDLDGIGPSKAELIEETMLRFWQDNPQYAQSS